MAIDSGAQLVVKLEARVDKLAKDMAKAGKIADDAVRGIEDRFKKMNPSANLDSLKLSVAGLGGVFAGISLDKLVKGLAEANRQIAELESTAARVGVSTDRLQEIQFAGAQKGVDQKTIDGGLEGLGAKLNDARTQENSLTQLFEANNIKLRDRNGQMISINEALSRTAELMRGAATEFDKIKIAEAVGLSKEWVPVIGAGAAEFNKLASEAANAGAVIDADIIKKAREFDAAWNEVSRAFVNYFKSATVQVAAMISGLIKQVAGLAAALGGLAGITSLRSDADIQGQINALRSGDRGANDRGAQGQEAGGAGQAKFNRYANFLTGRSVSTDGAENAGTIAALEKELETRRKLNLERARSLEILDRNKPPLKETVVNTDKKGGGGRGGGGGGGGGVDEAEQAETRLNRYIETLVRATAQEQARIDTMGRSRAEQLAAIEIAKAQNDLNKLDAETRQQIIDKLTQQVTALENVRAAHDRQKQAIQGVNDVAQLAGQSLITVIEGFADGGDKGEEALKRLSKQLANLVLQAALLGQGPLANLFGTAPATGSGSVGGLFGLIAGAFTGARAEGGPVRGGGTYLVGEKGPELLTMGRSGYVTPNKALPRAGSGGATKTVNITLSMAGANGDEAVARIAREQAFAAVRMAVAGERGRDRDFSVRMA